VSDREREGEKELGRERSEREVREKYVEEERKRGNRERVVR
jgi:hypothetical protein